jgi:hypothetical protein
MISLSKAKARRTTLDAKNAALKRPTSPTGSLTTLQRKSANLVSSRRTCQKCIGGLVVGGWGESSCINCGWTDEYELNRRYVESVIARLAESGLAFDSEKFNFEKKLTLG